MAKTKTVCLVVTPAIRKLAKDCNLDAATVTADISIWRKRLKDDDERKGDMEALPTAAELQILREQLKSGAGLTLDLAGGAGAKDKVNSSELRLLASDFGFADAAVGDGKVTLTQGFAEIGDADILFALAVDLGYVDKAALPEGSRFSDDTMRLAIYYEWQADAGTNGRRADLTAMFPRISEARRKLGVRVVTPATDRRAKMREVWGGFPQGYKNARTDMTKQIRDGMQKMYEEYVDGCKEKAEALKNEIDGIAVKISECDDSWKDERVQLENEKSRMVKELARLNDEAKIDKVTYLTKRMDFSEPFKEGGLFDRFVESVWTPMVKSLANKDRAVDFHDDSTFDAGHGEIVKHFPTARVTLNNYDDVKLYIANVYRTMKELFMDCLSSLGDSERVQLNDVSGRLDERDTEHGADAMDTERGVDEEDEFVNGEKVLERWQYDLDSVSAWDRMGPLIRSMFTDIQRDHMTTPFGTPVCFTPSSIIPKLITMLEHCRTSDEMLEMMEAKRSRYPWLGDVISKVRADDQLRALFFRKFSNARHLFAIVEKGAKAVNICNLRSHHADMDRRELIVEMKSALNGMVYTSEYSIYDSYGRCSKTGCDKLEQLLDTFKKGYWWQKNIGKDGKHSGSIFGDGEMMEAMFGEHPEMRDEMVDTIVLALKAIGLNINRKLVADKCSDAKVADKIVYHIRRIMKYFSVRDGENALSVVYDQNHPGKDMPYDYYKYLSNIFDDVVDSDVEPFFNEGGKGYYSFSMKSRMDEVSDCMSLNSYSNDEDVPEGSWVRKLPFDKMREEMHDDPFLFYWPEGRRYDDEGNKLPPLSYNTYLEARNPYRKEIYGLGPLRQLDDEGKEVGYEEGKVWGGLDETVKVLCVRDYENRTEYDKFSNGDFYDIMAVMYDNKSSKERKIIDDSKKDDDAYMTYIERMESIEGKGAWYPLFPTSDVQSYFFFHGQKLLRRTLIERSAVMARQELERMNRVDSATDVPACYYTRGKTFCFMDECNELNGGPQKTLEKYNACATEEEKQKLCEELARHWLNAKVEKAAGKLVHAAAHQAWETADKRKEIEDRRTREELMAMNIAFATAQATQLLLGDLAFYPDEETIVKRCKEVIVPKDKVDWANPQMNGKTSERVVYVDDVVVRSTAFDETKAQLERFVKEGRITREAYDRIIDGLSGIKITDGQSYRTFESMMEIGYMRGLFKRGDKTDEALRRIASGSASKADYKEATNSLPAVKSYTNGMMPVVQKDGRTLMMPFQYKLSEQLMTAAFQQGLATTGMSPALVAMNDYAVSHGIDVFMFTSCVKTGNNGAIRLDGTESGTRRYGSVGEVRRSEEYKSIMGQIESQLDDGGKVHEVPYRHYGTVSEVKDESLDGETLLGSQISKLVEANMPDDPEAEFVVEGRTMKRDQILDLYHKLIIELLNRKFKKLSGKLMDVESVSRMLKRAAANSGKGCDSLSAMFEVDERGRFIIPLSDMSTMRLSSEFLNSMVRRELTKIKFKGGHFVQASAFGLNDSLHVTVEKDGTLTVPIYISAWHRRLIDSYMDKDGLVDVGRMAKDDPGLLEMFGFRIPTEGKQFAMNMKVAGILPQVSGSTIIMPSDIIAYTDSDFDIDKIFMMIPEFETMDYDEERARKAYDKEMETVDRIAKMFRDDRSGETMRGIAAERPTFEEWLKENKQKFKVPREERKLRKIRFDYDSFEQTGEVSGDDRQLRNAIIDVMRSMVSSPCVRHQVLKSGGIEEAKRIADEMKELAGDDLSDMPVCDAVSTAERRASNNEGKNMIAIFAVANCMHAIAQKTDLSLGDGIVANLFGHSLSSLHGKRGVDGVTYINDTLGTVIGASSDNVNYPTLHYLGIGENTADVAELLLRLGCTLREVALFMNLDPIRKFNKYGRSIEMYENEKFNTVAEVKSNINEFKLDAGGMEALIRETKEMKEPWKDERNVAAFKTFRALKAIASQIYDIDFLTRNDTGKGVPKGSLDNNMSRMVRYYITRGKLEGTPLLKGWERMFEVETPSGSAMPVIMDSPVKVAQAYTSFVARGAFDIMAKLYPGLRLSAGGDVAAVADTTNFLKVVTETYGRFYGGDRINDDAIGRIARNLFIYSQSSFRCFCKPGLTAQQSRDWYINAFPAKLKEVVERYGARLGVMEFIKRLVPTEERSELNSRFFITFDVEGRPSKEKRDQWSGEWEALLGESAFAKWSEVGKSPELRELAIDLFKYCFWRNGMQFGDKTFAHLAPVAVKEATPGYVDTLNAFADGVICNTFNFDRWIVQFLRNNLRDKYFCPKTTIRNGGRDSLVAGLGINESDATVKLTTEMLNAKYKKYFRYFRDKVKMPNTNKWTGDPILAFEDGGRYYILQSWDPGMGVATYVKTTPLGFGSQAREYDSTPGVDSYGMRTVYDQTKYKAHGYKVGWNYMAKTMTKKKQLRKDLTAAKAELALLNGRLEKVTAEINDYVVKLKERYTDREDKKWIKALTIPWSEKSNGSVSKWASEELRNDDDYVAASRLRGQKEALDESISKQKDAIKKIEERLKKGRRLSLKALRKGARTKEAALTALRGAVYEGKYDREDAAKDGKSLYVFIDNGGRSSGEEDVPGDSRYARKYAGGKQLKYPAKATTACLRGLDNAMPLTLVKRYVKGDTEGNRWTDADAEEFRSVIRADVDAILERFNGDEGFEKMVWPVSKTPGEGIYGAGLADITKERTPKLREILEQELARLEDGIAYDDEDEDEGASDGGASAGDAGGMPSGDDGFIDDGGSGEADPMTTLEPNPNNPFSMDDETYAAFKTAAMTNDINMYVAGKGINYLKTYDKNTYDKIEAELKEKNINDPNKRMIFFVKEMLKKIKYGVDEDAPMGPDGSKLC